LDARDVGANRVELAPKLLGSVGLEVVHVHVGRAARQIDKNCGLVLGCRGGARLGTQAKDVSQRQVDAQGPSAQSSDLQEIAAGKTVAELFPGPPESEHW